MFDNVLSKVGIGSAEVDTVLEDDVLYPGQEFAAQVVVEGGNTEQEIEGLELRLVAELNKDSDEDVTTNEVMASWPLNVGEFTIHEGEQRVFDFQARLPYETPVTSIDAPRQYSKVWIHTGLDIDDALDAKDKDYLTVAPTTAVQQTLDAVAGQGYRIKEITLDPDQIRVGEVRANLPVDQEFVFEPEGRSTGGIKEIEVHFLPRESQTMVLLEFDYHSGSEQFESVAIDHASDDAATVEQKIRRFF